MIQNTLILPLVLLCIKTPGPHEKGMIKGEGNSMKGTSLFLIFSDSCLNQEDVMRRQ
jgi:hypothetical protein